MYRSRIVGTICVEPLAERTLGGRRYGDATLGELLASFAHCERLADAPDCIAPQRLVACRVSRIPASEPADAFARANLAALVEELEAEFSEFAIAAGL